MLKVDPGKLLRFLGLISFTLVIAGCLSNSSEPEVDVSRYVPAVENENEDNDMSASGDLVKATFGGGCFWCTEAIYQEVEGVQAVESGYAGG